MAQFFNRDSSYMVDIDGGPVAPDGWKRAVYRQPPRHFSIEILPPERQGSNYAYGMRICPMQKDDDRSSSLAGGSHSEYKIWRRWEDCLWFQDSFELEYAQMSRAKRKRLAAGKGVKKNGIYIQKDKVASFASLPPGPDPHSVAKNIHDYVPMLTKKGTFRVNQATIDQRYQELKACIEGLFQEGAPMLIQELRESQKVTDFFGYWRRDFDLALKQQKGKGIIEKQPRTSISSSMFETYFSSTPNLTTTEATLVNPPGGKSHKSPAGKVATLIKFGSKPSSHSSSDDDFYPHRGSDGSTSSWVGPPSPPSTLYSSPSPYIDIPVVFGHNPMESLPEDEELVTSMSGMNVAPHGKSVSPKSRGCNATADGSDSQNAELSADSPYDRLSAASIDPASYLPELKIDFTLPKCPSAISEFPRGSVASFATFMTDSSADAIIPLSLQSDHRRSFSTDSTRTRTLSDAENSLPNLDEDLDSYFDETPVGELPSSMSLFSFHSSSSRGRSQSSTLGDFTSSSDSSSVSGDGSISVKVVHNTSIILLRIHQSISFGDLRAKIYDKFVQQEGVPLSASFALAFLPPAPIDYSEPRSRSSFMSSVGFPDLAHMRFISSTREWQHAIALTGRGKLTLWAIGDQGF
ncbi:hypothetical protein PILCRDRAFT_810662 [Piloderma croceum F 1598]|uniref:PX domain-containing protein n=1 Tax=Piloderma croceum (strain F 1598) TaxID=765440 RepID=A0A0C3G541_PILCF|nr:hypothetical protein PILCRDRAFT_810662 [Piloderma croceum F 1598]